MPKSRSLERFRRADNVAPRIGLTGRTALHYSLRVSRMLVNSKMFLTPAGMLILETSKDRCLQFPISEGQGYRSASIKNDTVLYIQTYLLYERK